MIALIAVTENGNQLSKKVAGFWKDCNRYTFYKYADAESTAFDDLHTLTAKLWNTARALVFFSACGIAVRMVAPLIRSKQTDPAVIAVDEHGKYVVSLLSGHLGGANALTAQIAALLGAEAVITTATDSGKMFSPDLFAKENELHICELNLAKEAAAAVIHGKPLGFSCDFPCDTLPKGIFTDHATIGIHVTECIKSSPFPQTLHLLPHNVILGIGCKKNTALEKLQQFVIDTMKQEQIPLERICAVHSIDRKQNEPALLALCKTYDWTFRCFSAEILMQVKGDFQSSTFVMQTVGADNICERAAAVTGGELIVRKICAEGMTLAAATLPIRIHF